MGVHACLGTAEGVPRPVETNRYVHTFTNVPSTLYEIIARKRFEAVTVLLINELAMWREQFASEGRYYMTTGQQWEGVNDLVSIHTGNW